MESHYPLHPWPATGSAASRPRGRMGVGWLARLTGGLITDPGVPLLAPSTGYPFRLTGWTPEGGERPPWGLLMLIALGWAAGMTWVAWTGTPDYNTCPLEGRTFSVVIVANWKVVRLKAVADWMNTLEEEDVTAVKARIDYLAESGPGARRPIVGKIEASRHANMKELVCPNDIRILFAFDPQSRAVLLVGGAKTDKWKSWYRENIPIADNRFDQWLKQNDQP